jgi:S-adenosylmethionine hydrolase|tara:strand:- start:4111 stop:4296 length:186 start_codon:yes stop_codon:yes gene_type:complete
MSVIKKAPAQQREVRQAQSHDLNEQEVTFMLQHLSSSTFEGRDVLLLASVVAKLQGMLQEG